MKIVIINHSDTLGGASVVSRRLMHALRSLGHDAWMLVTHRASDDPHVVTAAPKWRSRLSFLAEHARIFLNNGHNREDLFKASIATDGLQLATHPLVRNADAVILNWVNQGMLSLYEIGRIAEKKRVLWTMHDMWNLTGICHHAGKCTAYTGTCSNCRLLHSEANEHDLSYLTWQSKKALYDTSGIRFIAVSSWLKRKAEESALMKGRDIQIIPNAFPVEDFYIEPKDTAMPFCLPHDKRLILMGAARLDDPIKGFPMAIEALESVEACNAMAVFFGAIRDPSVFRSPSIIKSAKPWTIDNPIAALSMPHRWLGPVKDAAMLRELYSRACVVISSSLYETLPGTLIEGQAAGCVPVAFDSGGQSDIIDSPATGFLVPPYDTTAFATAIYGAVNTTFDREALRESVQKKFSATAVAEKYIEALKD